MWASSQLLPRTPTAESDWLLDGKQSLRLAAVYRLSAGFLIACRQVGSMSLAAMQVSAPSVMSVKSVIFYLVPQTTIFRLSLSSLLTIHEAHRRARESARNKDTEPPTSPTSPIWAGIPQATDPLPVRLVPRRDFCGADLHAIGARWRDSNMPVA
jgi:hypothetical protein